MGASSEAYCQISAIHFFFLGLFFLHIFVGSINLDLFFDGLYLEACSEVKMHSRRGKREFVEKYMMIPALPVFTIALKKMVRGGCNRSGLLTHAHHKRRAEMLFNTK